MEVLFPLAAIAAIGFVEIYGLFGKKKIFLAIIFISLIYNIVLYHPYETSFYNLFLDLSLSIKLNALCL